MAQYAMLINLDKCVGCHSCAVVCKQENNVGLGVFWNKVLTIGPFGEYPDLEIYYMPANCQHCETPECVSVCPTGASYKREDGIVLVDHDKCIGCQYCVMACPYGVRSYSKDEGVIEKCTLCVHKINNNEEPPCVSICPGQARIVGDIDDPNSEISKAIKDAGDKVHRLSDVGNKPSSAYVLSHVEWRG